MSEKQIKDITAPEVIEISIREDGRVVWINNGEKCLFRACRIEKLVIDDRRDIFTKGSINGVK